MAAESRPFGSLFAEATRNGINRPKAVRGAGVKMVNMGELFAFPRLRNAAMDRVPFDESEARFLLKGGDLLFARQSLVLEGAGKCSLFVNDVEPVTFESHITRVRLDQSKADPTYYFYYLQSHHGRSAIRSIVEQGAGASGIRGSDLESLEVQWRPLHEQRAIAHILGTLDDKIEVNQRMNETLEEMARALFKSWFVDFDPVRRKAEGRDPGLPKHLADLFPSRFVDAKQGQIPNGWSEVPLQDAFWFSDGRTLPPEKRSDHSAYPAFGANGVIGRTDSASVHAPCIVMGKIGSCGALHRSTGPCWVTNNAFSILAGSSESLEFVWHTLQEIDFSPFVGGSANPYLPRRNFGHSKVVLPSQALLRAFESQAAATQRRVEAANEESRALAALRDALLTNLISGKLRVKDADRFLAKVTA